MSEIRIKCMICFETIALADTDTLRRPMMGSMFKTIDTWHGIPDPFEPGLDWEAMRCPFGRQHRPFTTEDHVMLESGEILEINYPGPPKPGSLVNEEEKDQETEVEVFICQICGREAKSYAGLAAHMRVHK